MTMSEWFSQAWAKVKLAWYIFAAVAVVLGLLALRAYMDRRAAAAFRRAQTLKSANATGEAIENAETERIRLRHEASQHTLKAQQARARADGIAARLEKGGQRELADMVKEWNQ
jgi:flagellar biosynthesis/type III secretory pathway M-ring protein FliF/YscJ